MPEASIPRYDAPPPSPPQPGTSGWMAWFDLVIAHTSAGKDSQTALRYAVAEAISCNVLDRFAALHIDLGERIDWPQVPELAAAQAARWGLPAADAPAWSGRMHVTRRLAAGDLLDDMHHRRKRNGEPRGFPTMWTRYCTSDWKTAPGRAFTESLCVRIRQQQRLARPVRVLQIMGFRAAESADRASRAPFAFQPRLSAKTKRLVFQWLPIHHLSTAQVWDDIRESGVPYHPVYDEGLSRLSCRHCILSSVRDLAISKRLSPDTAADYAHVEADLGDSFQHNRSFASIIPEPGPHGLRVRWTTCPVCRVAVLARAVDRRRHCPAHARFGPWAALPGNPRR